MNAKHRIVYVNFPVQLVTCATCIMDQLIVKGDMVMMKAHGSRKLAFFIASLDPDQTRVFIDNLEEVERQKITMSDLVITVENNEGQDDHIADLHNFALEMGIKAEVINETEPGGFEGLCGGDYAS